MEVTAASDVYSLGVVGYECLCGARPFDGASQVAIALAHINRPPPPLPSHVPPAVRLLVERALAKDPADRFTDGGAFAEAIRRVAGGGTLTPVVGPGTTPTQVVSAGGDNSRTQVIAVTDATAVAGAPDAAPPTGPAGPMPPLQATPEDDDRWADEPEGRRRGRRWLWLVAALALLLLLGGGAWLLLKDDTRDNDATGNTLPTATSAGATAVVIDPATYVGEPADDVEEALSAQGLEVVRETADGGQLEGAGMDLEAGDVAALAPTGSVPSGAQITLYVADEAFSREEEAEPTDDEEPTTTSATTTSAAPTTTDSPESTTSEPETTTSESETTSETTELPGEPEDPPAEEEPPPPVEGDADGDGVVDVPAAGAPAGAADPGGAE
jgi:serine/threonine-protein kinase